MKHFYLLISTFFYAGYLPISGTSTSLIVLILSMIIFATSLIPIDLLQIFWIISIILGFFLGVLSSGQASKNIFFKPDPSEIVIDEVIGMIVALIPIVFIRSIMEDFLFYSLIAFISFRIFDILKPSLIGKSEQIRGGWGIMLDDLLSGMASVFVLLFIWGVNKVIEIV